MRLIDADKAVKRIAEEQDKATTGTEDVTYYRAIKIIREQPTIEAKPIKPMLDLVEHIQMMLCTIYDTGGCIQPRDMECLTKSADKLRELIKESGCDYDKP